MKVTTRLDASICNALYSNSLRRTRIGRPRDVANGGPRRSNPTPTSDDLRRSLDTNCTKSSVWLTSTFLPALPTYRPQSTSRPISTSCAKPQACAAAEEKSLAPPPLIRKIYTRDELLSFVDQQGAGPVNEYLEFHRDPYHRGYAQSDGPHITISDKKEDLSYPSLEDAVRGDDELRSMAAKLGAAIGVRLRHPHRVSLETIYDLYEKLPEPRMLHMSGSMRHRLLRVLGTPRKRDIKSMLRYFSVVSDTKNCGIALRRTEWNHALSLASRYVGTTTEVEAESTLKLWSEMERDARKRGNEVTFNILFDVASKSGNFTLAEMIYKEMESRRITFNRYHHVSLIHFFGLKMDGDGVRAAYREMVEAGEMVDTVVLNCVISGLLKSGEESAADEVYNRMKDSNLEKPTLPERDYVTNKVITKVLMMFTKLGKEHPMMRTNFQQSVQLTPDIQTYRVLINHFAVKLGDLSKVAQYLDEMKSFKVPLHGALFLALFKGFYLHGGFPNAAWSAQRLDNVLEALISALHEGAKGLRLDSWLVIWILKAYKKCRTDQEVEQVYDLLHGMWDLHESREKYLEGFVQDLLGKQLTPGDTRVPWGNKTTSGRLL